MKGAGCLNIQERYKEGRERITVIEDSRESQSKFHRSLPFGVEMQLITAAPFFDRKIEDVIHKFKPSLIILDMSLIESTDSGFRVLKQLKESKALKDIPVVLCSKFISTDPADKYKGKAENLGAVAALPKIPFPDINDFLRFIKPKKQLGDMQVEVS